LAIRIYALAKQLKMDSKVLADVCAKAGVTGKGSALASLSDEELAKVNAYLDKPKQDKAAAAAYPGIGKEDASAEAKPLRREDYMAPTGTTGGKVPSLGPVRGRKPRTTKTPAAAETPPGETLAVEPAVAETPPAETPVAGAAPLAGKRAKTKLAEKVGPAIKLAPMPAAKKRAATKPKSKEPSPQRPDIKLPLDAIRAGKAGSKPLSEHIRKHEQKKKADETKVTAQQRKGIKPAPLPDGPLLPPKDRSRRSSRFTSQDKTEKLATLGGREQRQLRRKRGDTGRRGGKDQGGRPLRRRTRIRRTGANTAAPRKGKVIVELPCTVRGFSEAVSVSVASILSQLMELGSISNITASLDPEMAELLAAELGVDVEFRHEVDVEDKLAEQFEQEEDPDTLQPRPPIITFLGHVDHGKTSLLDKIINIDVVSGEKGGITQHIRAYQIARNGRAIAFVDTPGHEAFTEMRARGANVTDIAVLVVAADDGVMPQTEEAISHARAAGVPIVVALNKIDLPGANEQRVFEQLAANELLPSQWGGDTEVVKTSAITGEGIDELMETLLTVAELQEYRTNPDGSACGTCLEAELHEGRGVVSKMLVQKGTMRVGDVIVCGSAFGRVKAMYDTLKPRKRHKEAGPSMPVNVTGLDIAPDAGDRFYVLDDISEARQIAEQRETASRVRDLVSARPHVTLETLFDRLSEESELQTLNVILRADVRGSIEAIRKELTKLEHPEVQIKILQATVGGITEADVHLADASDAIIIGFNVVPDEGARALVKICGVQIRRYDIIYQLTEDLKAALEGMLRPEELEKELGRALVQQTFSISRVGTVAGCRVLAGNIERDARIRVIRESRVIGDYRLNSLKREKDDIKEVREGLECGMRLAGFNDLKEGDVLEAYKIEEVARTF